MKKKIIIAASLILALAIGFGAGSIIAAGTAGSHDDPLITLSYLNEKFAPQLVEDINAKIKTATDELAAKVTSGSGTSVNSGGFALVTLTSGQNLYITGDTEALLRTGSVSASGNVVDTSTGTPALSGGLLTINHMYLLSSGLVTAQSASTILIKGAYTIQ